MKKKFTVTFECKATLDVEVVAETREEAMRIANSELTEIQKLHICQRIIEQAKDNGIQED